MLNVHEFGPVSGSPVLALHGLTGHGARFAHFAAHELPDHRVLAPDLRGHGHSPWLPPWNLEQHVSDLLELFDAWDLPPVAVLGHSFGGAVATHLACTAPDRVTHLVLLDPAIGLDPRTASYLADEMLTWETFDSPEQAAVAKRAAWPDSPDWAIESEVAQHLDDAYDGFRWRYNTLTAITAWSEMARPHRVPPTTPILLMPATGEDFVTAAFIEDCLRAGNLTLHEVPTGHQVYFDAEAEVGAAVRSFLST